MGLFEEKIPEYIKTIKILNYKLYNEKNDLKMQLHDCDCEFCDITADYNGDEDAWQAAMDKIESDLQYNLSLIAKLEAHQCRTRQLVTT